MYQHVFQTQGVMHFESGKTPRVMRYVVSDDPHWASGYHMHENETELIWVERGTVEVMVNANKYVAHAGDIIAVEHGKFHMLASSDADPAKTFTCAVYGFKFHDVRGESLILEPDSVPVVHAALGVDTIRTLFRENFKLAARPGKDKQLKNALIRDVLVYLNENYREKITLEALSKRFRASVSYIAHEFAREYGVSPINYVIERRITEAKFALTTTTQSLNQIAWHIGYENTYHFSKLFQRHVGCSPSEYRRRFGKSSGEHPDEASED